MVAVAALMMAAMAQAEKLTSAQVDRVTIFASGAQVERSKSVNLTAGEQVVTITGLSPYLDVNSLQVKAKGRLTVLGVNHRQVHADSAVQAKRLADAENDVRSSERKVQQVKDEREMLATQLELVKTNCSVASRTVATPLASIKELNNYYAQEVLAVKKRGLELDELLTTFTDELARKTHTRDSLRRLRPSMVTEVTVKVHATQAGRADFSIAYYVGRAGWFASYDVRSNSVKEPLQLSYKANIYQDTKEDWSGIHVVLSSANPSRSNVAPKLITNWLDFEPEYRSNRHSGAFAAKAMAVEKMVAHEEDAKSMEDAELEESTLIETATQQALFGYEFDIKPLLTLPNGGRAHATTIELSRHELLAGYEYHCYPKYDKEAFLVADATDWGRLSLLPGEATVYFDNSFVGKSEVDPLVATDTLHFSLGRDQSIRVQRMRVDGSSSSRFLGSSQEQTKAWRITVKNSRQEAVALKVYDQVPVARNQDISVKVEELSGGQLNKATGIVCWRMELQPGEQQELLLQYQVRYPKNRRLLVE